MSTIAERVQSQKDILETIEAIYGYEYAQFVKHSMSSTMIAAHVPADLQEVFVLMMSGILGDLSVAWKINLEDPATQRRIVKDLNALRSAAMP